MQNEGFEFVINSDNIVNKSLKWSTSLNLSVNNNKVVKLDGDQTIIPGNDGRYLNSLVVGSQLAFFTDLSLPELMSLMVMPYIMQKMAKLPPMIITLQAILWWVTQILI